ncbi:MAG: hypothetical protein ACJ8F7_12365 [Gemmataceae bacterium]
MTASRRELLDLLAELSERYPDMRLGQLVANFASLAARAAPEAVYDIEDDAFVVGIRSHLSRRDSGKPGAAAASA